MLANFLSKTKPINYAVLLILFVCCYLITFVKVFFKDGFVLEALLNGWAFLLLLLVIVFIFNFIVFKNRLTLDNSFAIYIFLLLLLLFLPNLFVYKTLFLLVIHLLFLRKIYSLKHTQSVLKKLFDAGFWLGISFLIEPLLLLFFVCIYVGTYLHQKISFQTLFSPIIGFITPLLLCFTYFFWHNRVHEFLALLNAERIDNFLWYSKNTSVWFLAGLLLASILSFLLKSPKALSINNSFKKNWILLIFNLFIALLFGLLLPEKNGYEFLYLLIPASIIIANGLEVIKKDFIKNTVLIALLVGVIVGVFFL